MHLRKDKGDKLHVAFRDEKPMSYEYEMWINREAQFWMDLTVFIPPSGGIQVEDAFSILDLTNDF